MLDLSALAFAAAILWSSYTHRFVLVSALAALYGLAWLVNRQLLDATGPGLDLPTLGQPLDKPRLSGTALIAGGSIGGIIHARVLADHFAKVIVVDDDLQEDEKGYRRPHVYQFDRLHQQSYFAYLVLGRLFPQHDIQQEVKAVGGRISRLQKCVQLYADGGNLCFSNNNPTKVMTLRRDTSVKSAARVEAALSISRFERMVRRLVLENCANIEVVRGRVTGLQRDAQHADRISKVDVALLDGASRTIEANLVVDATGASSAGQKWLRRLGYQVPSKEVYNPGTHWNEVRCELTQSEFDALPDPPNVPKAEMASIFQILPPKPNAGVGGQGLIRLDGRIKPHRLSMVYGLWTRDATEIAALPTTPEGMLQASKNLDAGPYATELLEHLQKHQDFDCIRSVAQNCTRVYYDKVDTPHNFIATSDAICALNSIHGQGITQACRCAVTLDKMLRLERQAGRQQVANGFSKTWHKKVLKRCDTLHNANKAQDALWDCFEITEGENRERPKQDVFAGLARGLVKAAHTDPKCGDFMWQVMNGLVSPLALLGPEMLCRIGWAHVWHHDFERRQAQQQKRQ